MKRYALRSLGYAVLPASLSLILSGQAGAQDLAPATRGAGAMEEVTVTASRIPVDGFSAPTPVTVVDAEQMRAVAPVDVGQALAQLPQFTTSGQTSTAVAYANLRSIGSERTLVLIDGRRHVPTFSSGVVDLKAIPTSVIARTEIVTGGASASWGSDAVSGVVNLILKDELQGIEGNVQYGESRYGDDESYGFSIAGGTQFAGGRGHVLVGAEYTESKGVRPFLHPYRSRPYGSRGVVTNSDFSTGLPQYIYAEDVRRADVHDGGLITSGPLMGTIFLPNGQTGQFEYGERFGNNMIGGGSNAFDMPDPGGDAKYPFERTAFLARLRYAFTDSLEGTFEFNYSEAISEGLSVVGRNQGSLAPNPGCTRTGYSGPRFGNINVSIDNAFLPEHIRQAMIDNGINCFNFGRTFREEGMGDFGTEDGSPGISRFVAGLAGELSEKWSWDAYVQYGDASFRQRRIGNIHSVRFQNAVDAVFDEDGEIVCRINIDDDPANDDPSCVPFNMFGAGSPSMEARRYVIGTSGLDMDIEQTVAAFNVQGDVAQGWAGPINAAFGVEYRKEEIFAYVDPDSDANLWQTTNRKGIEGEYDVKEVYAELLLPLAEGLRAADSLDLNLAVRSTEYSSSGSVTTWKIGSTWDVNDQLRFRTTLSRDIRAGNLGELFTPTAVAIANVTHPITSVTVPVQIVTSGNPQLDPEEADTFTFGVVVSPSGAPGLQLSADYYTIEINGVIDTLSGQDTVDQCYIHGQQQFCDRITLDSNGVIVGVDASFANLDRFETSGVDLAVAWSGNVGPGELSFRVLSTYVGTHETTFLRDGSVESSVGEFFNPRWKVFSNIRYAFARNASVGVDWRWYGGGNIDNNRIEGFAGPQGTNINKLPAVHYTNLNFSYELPELFNSGNAVVYLRVDNLFDKDPPFPLRTNFFDNLGREYRAGMRFDFGR